MARHGTGEVLVVARILQVIAGALVVPSSLAMIVKYFSGPAQSRAIGRWSGWTRASAIAAPLIGGASVDYLSWRFFFVNVLPIALLRPVVLQPARPIRTVILTAGWTTLAQGWRSPGWVVRSTASSSRGASAGRARKC